MHGECQPPAALSNPVPYITVAAISQNLKRSTGAWVSEYPISLATIS
jgi:hypothetical protein